MFLLVRRYTDHRTDPFLADREGAEADHGLVIAPNLEHARLRAAAERRRAASVPRVFFYARPGKPRNLYGLGVAALREASVRLSRKRVPWQVMTAGEPHAAFELAGGQAPVVMGKMGWGEYFDALARIDVGLSLMHSPHPSHPPLELAVSGARAVTNGLDGYRDGLHPRITTAREDVLDLAEALVDAIEHAADEGPGPYTPLAPGVLGADLTTVVDELVTRLEATSSTQVIDDVGIAAQAPDVVGHGTGAGDDSRRLETGVEGLSAPWESGADVLLTQRSLHGFGGSEVLVLELSEFFAERGCRVLVLAGTMDAGFVRDNLTHPLITVMQAHAQEVDDELRTRQPGFAWIQHNVVPAALLRGEITPHTVFAHLSPLAYAEKPLIHRLEAALASAVVFPSPGTRDTLVEELFHDGVDADLMHVFPNPAPDAFAEVAPVADAGRRRLLVVSNHLPDDLRQAVEMLGDDVEVRHIGIDPGNRDERVRVTPEVLADHDAVVTIGKTVQYSMLAGRPVFCYDHFGGPGWLNADNLDQAAYRTFSGRGFSRRKAAVLAAEIWDGWADALTFAAASRDEAARRYTLSGELDRLWLAMRDRVPIRDLSPAEAASAGALIRLMCQLTGTEAAFRHHQRAVQP